MERFAGTWLRTVTQSGIHCAPLEFGLVRGQGACQHFALFNPAPLPRQHHLGVNSIANDNRALDRLVDSQAHPPTSRSRHRHLNRTAGLISR